MRATWPGARSGRISMTTWPWVVSRISLLVSLIVLDSLFVASIYEDFHIRAARQRVAERFRERQRRAGVDGGDCGALVERLGLRRSLGRHIGEARLALKGAAAREGQHHGHIHAGPRLRQRGLVGAPADLERDADVAQGVER